LANKYYIYTVTHNKCHWNFLYLAAHCSSQCICNDECKLILCIGAYYHAIMAAKLKETHTSYIKDAMC